MAGCGFSVLADDHQGFAKAVIKLSEMSGQEREELGKKGRAYVQEHHNMVKLTDKLEALF
jgi:hypothetical protein